MTDQPTQDAIVSQRAKTLWEILDNHMFVDGIGKRRLNGDALSLIARFEAEIEAATIERCAGLVERLASDPYQHDLATDIRNLKGQTS